MLIREGLRSRVRFCASPASANIIRICSSGLRGVESRYDWGIFQTNF